MFRSSTVYAALFSAVLLSSPVLGVDQARISTQLGSDEVRRTVIVSFPGRRDSLDARFFCRLETSFEAMQALIERCLNRHCRPFASWRLFNCEGGLEVTAASWPEVLSSTDKLLAMGVELVGEASSFPTSPVSFNVQDRFPVK